MTKQDYELIAATIASVPPTHSGEIGWGLKLAVERLADAFQAQNPRFDRMRFIRSCKLT